MNLKDLLLLNRSYRSFDSERQISREELLALVNLTRFTPSSVNIQPLKYILTYTAEQSEILLSFTRWAKALPDLTLPPEGHHPTAFITICHDTSVVPEKDSFLRDVGIVAQSILLGAVETGLGGCMIGSFDKDGVRALYNLDEKYVPKLVIALGKPDDKIVLTEAKNGDTKYYRDESGKTHYVPKRSLEEIIIK